MFGVGPIELLIMAILVAVFVGLILRFLVRSVKSEFQNTVNQNNSSAEEVLDQRYASGEIMREEYLTIRDDIKREQNA